MGREQLLEEIARGSSGPLFVHTVASLRNAERFYLAIASFPVVNDTRLLKKTKRLVLNAEDMGIIYLKCLNSNQAQRNTRTTRGFKINRQSLSIAVLARPKNMPNSPFRGANIVLPETQDADVAGTNVGQIRELRQLLEEYYEETKQPYLPDLNGLQLREQLSLAALPLRTIQHVYATIVRENGQVYQTYDTRAMAYSLVVLYAVIKYCESRDPPLSIMSANGRYTRPDTWRLDWQQIVHLALELAPDGLEKSSFSKEMCWTIWSKTGSDGYEISSHAVFEQRNWDVLRGMCKIHQLRHILTVSRGSPVQI